MQEFKSSCDFQNEMNFDSGICVAITSNDNSVKITNTPVSTSSSSATIETSVTTSTTTPQITATKILSSTLTTNKNVINYYKRIEEFKKILYNLQRDKEFRDLQRKHLSQILERKPKKIIREICNVCFANLDREDPKTCTSCCNCKKYICRGQNCSIWIPNQAEWECRLCYLSNESRSRTSEWINRQQQQQQQNLLTNKFRHSMKNIRSGFSTPIHNYDGDYHNLFNSLEHYRSSPHLSSLDEREKIRRYIEETISQMLGGGSLDDVSVGQLYDNKEYLKLFHKYHSSLSKKLYSLENSIFRLHKSLGDLPQHEHYLRNDYAGVSNIKLRKLIEDIIEETHNLPPALTGTTPPPPITTNEQNNSNNRISLNRNENENLQYFDPKKYQELLATAVLNKIVNTCNCERKIEDNSSEILSTLSINLDKNDNTVTSKNNKSCSQSSSSIEPQSDSSLTDLANDLNHCHDISPCDSFTNICGDRLNQNFTDDESILNDYVKKHQIPLPELSISSESADEDFTSIATSNGQEGTWEDNWLFKRKKLGTDTSVGMLVPAPKEDIKALIGDKSADEMSDLSEAGSDFEDVNNNVDSLEPTNVRIHNQNVISGKDNIGLFDELIEQTSLISTSSLPENEPIFMETKNDFVLGNDGLSEIDNPKLSLSTGSVPSIKNEAVNVNVTSKISNDMKKTILHQTSVGNFEETIIDPPNDFTDDQKKTSNKAKQVNSLNSLPSDLTNAEKNFQDITKLSANEKFITTNNNFESSLDDFERLNSESTNTSRKHSAIEFLAAIALGPVLAFSTSELDKKVIHIPEKNFCDNSNQTTKNKDTPTQPTVIENEINIEQRIILEIKQEQQTNQYDVRTISKENTREFEKQENKNSSKKRKQVLKEISPITNKNDVQETKQQFDDDDIMKNTNATTETAAITEKVKSYEEKSEQQNISPSYNAVETSSKPVSESVPTTGNTNTNINVKDSTDIVETLSIKQIDTSEQQQPSDDTFETGEAANETKTESEIEKTMHQTLETQGTSHSANAEKTSNESGQEIISKNNSTKTTRNKEKSTSASGAIAKLSFKTHEDCSSKTKKKPTENNRKTNDLKSETQNNSHLPEAVHIFNEPVQEPDETTKKSNTTTAEPETKTSEIVVESASKALDHCSSETKQPPVDDIQNTNVVNKKVPTPKVVGIVQEIPETQNNSHLPEAADIFNEPVQEPDSTTGKTNTTITEPETKTFKIVVESASTACDHSSSETKQHRADETISINDADSEKIPTPEVVGIVQEKSETQNNSQSPEAADIFNEPVQEPDETTGKTNTTITEPQTKTSEIVVESASTACDQCSSETKQHRADETIGTNDADTEKIVTPDAVGIVQEKSETQNNSHLPEAVQIFIEPVQEPDETTEKTNTTIAEPETKPSEIVVESASTACDHCSSETKQHPADETISTNDADTEKIPTPEVVGIVQENSETKNNSQSHEAVDILNEHVQEPDETTEKTNNTLAEPETKHPKIVIESASKACEHCSSDTQQHSADETISTNDANSENIPTPEVVGIVQEKSETQNNSQSPEAADIFNEPVQEPDETTEKTNNTLAEPETKPSEIVVESASTACDHCSTETKQHPADETISTNDADTEKIPTPEVVGIVQEKSETQNNSQSPEAADIFNEPVQEPDETTEKTNNTIAEPETKTSGIVVESVSTACEYSSSRTKQHPADETISTNDADTEKISTPEVVGTVQENLKTKNNSHLSEAVDILNKPVQEPDSTTGKTNTTITEPQTKTSEIVVESASTACDHCSSETKQHRADETISTNDGDTEKIPTPEVVGIVQEKLETQNNSHLPEAVHIFNEHVQEPDETTEKTNNALAEPETKTSEIVVESASTPCENCLLDTQQHSADDTISINDTDTEKVPTPEVVGIVQEKSETKNNSQSPEAVHIFNEPVQEPDETIEKTNNTLAQPETKPSEIVVESASTACDHCSSETKQHPADETISTNDADTEKIPTPEVVGTVQEKSETQNNSHFPEAVHIFNEPVQEPDETTEKTNTTIAEPETKASEIVVESASTACDHCSSETKQHRADETICTNDADTEKIATPEVLGTVQEKSETQNNSHLPEAVHIFNEPVQEPDETTKKSNTTTAEPETKTSEIVVESASKALDHCSSETKQHPVDDIQNTNVVNKKVPTPKVVGIVQEIPETNNNSHLPEAVDIFNEPVQEPDSTTGKTNTTITEPETKTFKIVVESASTACDHSSSETKQHRADETLSTNDADTEKIPTLEVVGIVQEKSETKNNSQSPEAVHIFNEPVQEPDETTEKTNNTLAQPETKPSEIVVESASTACDHCSSETKQHPADETISTNDADTEKIPTPEVVGIVQEKSETQNNSHFPEAVHIFNEPVQEPDETTEKTNNTLAEPETKTFKIVVESASTACDHSSSETKQHRADETISTNDADTEKIPTPEVVGIVQEKSETKNNSQSPEAVDISNEPVQEPDETTEKTHTTIAEPQTKTSEIVVDSASKARDHCSSETKQHPVDETISTNDADTEKIPAPEVVGIVQEKSETQNNSQSPEAAEIFNELVQEPDETTEKTNNTLAEPETKTFKIVVESASTACDHSSSETKQHRADETISTNDADTEKIPTPEVVGIVQEKSETKNNSQSPEAVDILNEPVQEADETTEKTNNTLAEPETKASEIVVESASTACDHCSSETKQHRADETISTNDADTEKIPAPEVVGIVQEKSETQNNSQSPEAADILNKPVQEPDETTEKTHTTIAEPETKTSEIVVESASKARNYCSSETKQHPFDDIQNTNVVNEKVPTPEVVGIVQEILETQNNSHLPQAVHIFNEPVQEPDETTEKTNTTIAEPETKPSEIVVESASKARDYCSSETQHHQADETLSTNDADTKKVPAPEVVGIVQEIPETQNNSHLPEAVDIFNEPVQEADETTEKTNNTLAEPETKPSEIVVESASKARDYCSSETQHHQADETLSTNDADTKKVPAPEVVGIVQEIPETQNNSHLPEAVDIFNEPVQEADETTEKTNNTLAEPETKASEIVVESASTACDHCSSETKQHPADETLSPNDADTQKVLTPEVVGIVQEYSETQNNSQSPEASDIFNKPVQEPDETTEKTHTTIAEPETKTSEIVVESASKARDHCSSETKQHPVDDIQNTNDVIEKVPTPEVVGIVQVIAETKNNSHLTEVVHIFNEPVQEPDSTTGKTNTTLAKPETKPSKIVVDSASKACANCSIETQQHQADETLSTNDADTEKVPTPEVVGIVQEKSETKNNSQSHEAVDISNELVQKPDETTEKTHNALAEPETKTSEIVVESASKARDHCSSETKQHPVDDIQNTNVVNEKVPTPEVVGIVQEKSETQNNSHLPEAVENSNQPVQEPDETTEKTSTSICEQKIVVDLVSTRCKNCSIETQQYSADDTIGINDTDTETIPTPDVVGIVQEKSETKNNLQSHEAVDISNEPVQEPDETTEKTHTTIAEPETKTSEIVVESASKARDHCSSETKQHPVDDIQNTNVVNEKVPTPEVVGIVQEIPETKNNSHLPEAVENSNQPVQEADETTEKTSTSICEQKIVVDLVSTRCKNCSIETQQYPTDDTIRTNNTNTGKIPTSEVVGIVQEKSVTPNIPVSFEAVEFSNEPVQESDETIEKINTTVFKTESTLLDVVGVSHENDEPKLQFSDVVEEMVEESVQSQDITLLSNVVEDSGVPWKECITFIENTNSGIAGKELVVEKSSAAEQYRLLDTKLEIGKLEEIKNTTPSINILTENISIDIITHSILPSEDDKVPLDSAKSDYDAIKAIDTYNSVQYKTSKDPQRCNVLKTILKDSISSTLPLSSSSVIQSFGRVDSLSDQIISKKTNILVKNVISSDHCSSDSNSSDGSTSTVIDANEVLNQTVIEYFTRDEKQQTSLVPSKVIPISITNTTNQTNNTSAINDDLKIQNLESKCSNEDDYFNDSLPPLLPGSVAERERKKWLNAVDMPNNPYSPDALRRRLSDGPEKHIDIPNPILERASSEEKQISAADNTNEVRLQVDSKTEYEKYSRDYYINNDNENNNKRTTTQLNKNDNERILNEEKVSITATTTNNYSDNDKLSKNLTSDIYLAKIVHIEDYNKKINEQNNTEIESDNLLKRNNKKLTINNSNNNLLKLNRDSENENDIIKSPTTPTTPSLLNHQDDSLTPSEDSDTIRIYDLNKQETRIIKDDKTINDINKSTRPRILSFTAKLLSTNTTTSSSATIKKIVTPAALKFLQPKRKIFEPEQIMSDNEGTSSPVFEKREITPNTPNANKVPEKNVIEPEVAQALPSVKALAKAFLLTSAKCSTKHPERPRTRSTTSENGLNNIEKIKPSPDSYSPPYQQVTYSPIGPIVSQQQENNSNNNGTFKTEENDNICISSGINNDNDNNNDNELERPISPVLEPGKLKDNIAFFENLKKN